MENKTLINKAIFFLISTSLVFGQWKIPGSKSEAPAETKKSLIKRSTELLDIYTTEEDNNFVLVLEFSNSNIHYVTNETFAPPSVTISLDKVKWERGNFTKKSSHSPLFQYVLSVPRNNNQLEIKNTLQIKMGFTRVPVYNLKLEPASPKSPKYKLKVIWERVNLRNQCQNMFFPLQGFLNLEFQ